jgi:uncharacterized protein
MFFNSSIFQFDDMFFYTIGIIAVFLFTTILLLFFIEFLLVLFYRYHKIILLPWFSLKLMNLFYSPLKGTLKIFKTDEKIVDEALIAFANEYMHTLFHEAKGEKLIFAPQCLRAVECSARLDPGTGYICKECGKCVLGEISKIASNNHYVLFIVPGDSFVKRIVKKLKPASVIGIACFDELSMAMLVGIKMGVPSIGIPLLKSGCFNTLVDLEKIKENMI